MNSWATRRNAGISLISLLLVVVLAPGAGGQEEEFIVVPIDTVVTGPEGSTHLLESVEVPEPLRGQECLIAARADNQGSVHPGNDLVVESDGSTILLADVEREPGVVTVAEGELLLGDTLSVTLIMGPDGVFSAGVHVGVCAIPPPPTSTTTTIQPTTTLAPTTTTTTTTPTTAPPSTPPEATSTTVGPESTTTTVAVASTTTVAESTTTTGVSAESSTTSTLPFTGFDTDTTAGVGLVALALGMALVTLTRSADRTGRHSVTDS